MLAMTPRLGSTNTCGPVQRPWCPRCETDEFLLIESVSPCLCDLVGVVGLSYSCLECEDFSAHCVAVSEAGATLALMVAAMRR